MLWPSSVSEVARTRGSGPRLRVAVIGSPADMDLVAAHLDSAEVFGCSDDHLRRERRDAIVVVDRPPEQPATDVLASLRGLAGEDTVVVVAAAPSAAVLDRWMDLGADDVVGYGDLQRLRTILRREESQRHTRRDLAHLQHEFTTFSNAIAHDFRSPVRIILGYAQALIDDYGATLPQRVQHDLATISTRAQRMGEMIEAITAWSRIDAQPLRQVAIDMEALAKQAAAEWRYVRQLEFRIEPLPQICGDPALMQQVWALLLSNAVKFSRMRQPARITISAELAPDAITYRIQDNGVGFEPASATRLFRVFERLHSAAEFEGVGMGLAQVRRIVEKHRGTVAAQGVRDGGATFTFALPRS